MQIYPDEIDIQDKILANVKSHVMISNVSHKDQEDINTVVDNLNKFPVSASIASECKKEHPSLAYFSAILASVGINRNDDVFIPSATWKARNTCINSPYNNQHQAEDIIGHIYNARCLDKDSKVISSEEYDDYFDIECDFVLYKDIFPELCKEIIAGAQNNTLYVSMECMLEDLAYGLENSDGTLQIVSRNKDTAFLTKYLKAYGGPGTYGKRRIYRVLKSFYFCGIGNVDDPANLKSVYTKIQDTKLDNKKAFAFLYNTKIISENQTIMTKEEEMTIEQLTEDLKNANEKNVATKADLDKAVADLEAAKQEIVALQSKVEIASGKITELTSEKEAITNSYNEAKKQLDAIIAEKEAEKAKQLLASRIQTLTDLKVNVSDERKSVIASMSEDQFNALVDWTKEIASASIKVEDKLDVVVTDDKKDDAVIAASVVSPVTKDLNAIAQKIVNSLNKTSKNKKK